MPFRPDIRDAFAERIGGVGAEAWRYDTRLAAAQKALSALFVALDRGEAPAFVALPERTDDRQSIEEAATELRARAHHLVVLATGGSSLGAQAIIGALAPSGRVGDRRVSFLDNIDPAGVAALLESCDPNDTAFLVISKSGATAETLAQALAALAHVERATAARAQVKRATTALAQVERGSGERAQVERATTARAHVERGSGERGQRFMVITQPGDSPLRRFAEHVGARVLDHDPALGGRFSVLSLVGLLPALYLGLDVWAVRAGAADVLQAARAANMTAAHPAAEGAALSLALADSRGINSAVMLIYGDALLPFGRWYRQLLAESLGKDGKGLTPLLARGATDQHSALQLYLAGPADKFFTLLGPVGVAGGAPLDRALASSLGIAYLGGRTLDDLFAAEASATAAALIEAGRPVRRIALPVLDARMLGVLFMHFMIEIVLMAKLLGVNAYDQPAVERGKVLARQFLEGGTP